MSSDISRGADGYLLPNTGVVAQQGRVIVDRDINTLQAIISGRAEAEARDVVGPAGTPDDGFAIAVVQQKNQNFDFGITPGTMYVGGQRVVFPSDPDPVSGKRTSYSYLDQPDWPAPPLPSFGTTSPIEAVFLKVVEHELSAVEDPDILDVALGGVDTTQRLRQIRRVARSQVHSTDCAGAWAELTKSWLAAGLSFDPQTMRLTPSTTLLAGFDQSKAPPDPCDPVASGGYLGSENQLIRVQICSPGSTTSPPSPPQLVWGYDNGSFLYRVSGIASNGTMLQIARNPPDAFHLPAAGQAIEVLRTAAVIGGEPDQTDPTGQRMIVRCAAEETGFVTTLAQDYGTAIAGNTTRYLVLAQPLPAAYLNDPNPLFVRIWQGQQSFALGQAVEIVDPVKNTATGVTVTIASPAAQAPAAGAYWLIAVRPGTPQLVYPERLLSAPQPPDGPREWICPLAVIDWSKPQVHDCRQFFDNLVTLTKRPTGCCTVTIVPSDIGSGGALQKLIDNAATLAGRVTVCFGPGVFELSEPLRLGPAHDRLTLSSCAGGATLQGVNSSGNQIAFADGLVVVANASEVTLRGLHMTVPTSAPPQSLLTELQQVAVAASGGQARDGLNTTAMIGVHAVTADMLTIEDCSFAFPQPSGTADVFGAAIFLQGDCSGLTVRNCSFLSAIPPTYNLLAPSAVTPSAAGANVTPGIGAPGAAAAQPAGGTATGITPPASGGATTGTSTSGGTTSTSAAPPGPNPSLFDLDPASRLKAAGALPLGVITKLSPQLVATVGILVSSLVASDPSATPLACRLGNATIRGNAFTGLTMSVLMFDVDGQTVRLQDNDASGSVAGLWMFLSGAHAPTAADATRYYTIMAALSFSEALLAVIMGERYPIPTGATATVSTAISPTVLMMTNNGIEAIPSAQQSGPFGQQGSVAVFISANRTTTTNPGTPASVLLSGNRLRSQSYSAVGGFAVPTTMLVTPDDERCAITGNVILNEFQGGSSSQIGIRIVSGGSLIILPNTPPTSAAPVSLLAVAGNVLNGSTNLGDLLRSSTAGDSWLPYNSIINI